MHSNVLEIFVHFCGYSVRFSSLSRWTFNNDSRRSTSAGLDT